MKFVFAIRIWSARAAMRAILMSALLAVHSRADVAFAWNELLLYFTVKASDSLPPLLEARAFAMAHLAMHDAMVEATARNRPEPERTAVQRAAVVSAAQTILTQLFPDERMAIEALAQRHMSAIAHGKATAQGVDAGLAAADKVLSAREQDGWAELIRFHPPFGPRPDGSETAAAALAAGENPPRSPWLRAKPFGLKSAQQFEVTEVRQITRDGQILTSHFLQHSKLFDGIDANAVIAAQENWHARGPVMMWNRIARQLAAECGLDLVGQTRMLAALNVALADALLSALHWRHTLGSWRTMVVNYWNDELLVRSPDNTLTPPYDVPQLETRRLLIPPVANYPSVRATLAGAAESALRSFFRTDDIAFTLPVIARSPDDAPAGRRFTSISAAARECAFAASLSGGEIRDACIAGYSHGSAIGSYVTKRKAFMPD